MFYDVFWLWQAKKPEWENFVGFGKNKLLNARKIFVQRASFGLCKPRFSGARRNKGLAPKSAVV
jgi:hypothetical protein